MRGQALPAVRISSASCPILQVPVGSWFDDMTDTELRDLIPFFEKLSKVDDVYTVLRGVNSTAQALSSQSVTRTEGTLQNP